MSTRIYECKKCKKLLGLNDKDDDLKKDKICDNCNEKMIHIGTVGTSI